MIRREAYTKAMVESIKNSGMWLKEAKFLAEEGAKGHAQALVLFSDEELGKAMMCWMTINGVFPYNHWEVDFRCKRGIFRSHPMKNATAMGFTLALITQEQEAGKDETYTDPWTGDQVGLRDLLAKIGSFMTWARSRWMYVDIDSKGGSLEVWSPLNKGPHSVKDAIKLSEYCLRTFKQIVRRSQEEPHLFGRLFSDLRQALIERDDKFPRDSEWK